MVVADALATDWIVDDSGVSLVFVQCELVDRLMVDLTPGRADCTRPHARELEKQHEAPSLPSPASGPRCFMQLSASAVAAIVVRRPPR